MNSPPARTRKGAREATRILDSATTVLSREGFGAATLGRIAAEADVDKRMVLYYFGSREALLVEVVMRVGERVAANMVSAVEELSDPSSVAEVGMNRLWEGSTEEPELLRAYFALLSSAAESEDVDQALKALKARFTVLFDGLIDALSAQGYEFTMERDAYLALMMALWRGLALEWIEVGDTPAISGAVEEFKRIAIGPFERGDR